MKSQINFLRLPCYGPWATPCQESTHTPSILLVFSLQEVLRYGLRFQPQGGKEYNVHSIQYTVQTFSWLLLSFAAESSASGPQSGKAPYHYLTLPHLFYLYISGNILSIYVYWKISHQNISSRCPLILILMYVNAFVRCYILYRASKYSQNCRKIKNCDNLQKLANTFANQYRRKTLTEAVRHEREISNAGR